MFVGKAVDSDENFFVMSVADFLGSSHDFLLLKLMSSMI
jgi:hypothetical protein